MADDTMTWRAGGCHCGAVRFEAAIPQGVEGHACNCSICAMTAFIHLIVPESRFRILEGEDHLRAYAFNTGAAKHLFCDVCGVKAFYRPRSNPDGWSVNLRALDDADAVQAKVVPFDGQNWEASASALAHLSRD